MSIDDEKKRFTDLYKRESDSLFRFCVIRVSDREKALDITQEAFLRLWNSMTVSITVSRQKNVENPRAFLYVVARHLIIDWYRRIKSVSFEDLSGNDEDREFEIADPKAALEMEINADARRAISLLKALEPQYRDVMYFRYIEDLPPKDIAEILKLNANTVSVRLTRGMEALRKLMGIIDDHE